MATDARRRANRKHDAEKLDHIHLRIPKGQRDVIEKHAASRSESVNGFIKRAINETIERDNVTL